MPKKTVSDATYAQRLRESNEYEVLAAFEAQKYYNRMMHRRGSTDIDKFVKTATYTHFVKLIRFSKEVHLPDLELYIKLMVDSKRSPNTWCTDRSYRVFLQKMNTSTNATDAIRLSAKELQDFSEKAELPVKEIVSLMAMPDVLQMIRQRRISPWIILNSRLFAQKISESDASQRDALSKIVDPDYWTIVMAQNRKAIKFAKDVCSALEI